MGRGGQENTAREIVSPRRANRQVFPTWAKDIAECEKHFGVTRKIGLRSYDVEKRMLTYGYNDLEKHESQSIWAMVLDQFNDTLVRFQLVAVVISFILAWYDGEEGAEKEITAFVDPLVIFLILIVNAIVGVWQENKAERALEALKEIQSEHASVIRDGKRIANLPAKELVPGDIVELKVGDKVPADMRVLQLISSTLRIEQGSLTGESAAVNKTNKAVPEDSDIKGKRCMVFAGTTVVNGNCICLVTQTGMETEIGKVHEQIQEVSLSEKDTPLKKKLNEFGETLTKIIGVTCAFVWIINLKHFLTWDYNENGWPMNFKFSFEKCAYYFENSVELAVAAIPKGLPIVCLVLGTRKMAQKNALVRKLPCVETLARTTVICSDKTGTLTTNQMAVSKLVAMGSNVDSLRSFKVEGTTYNPFDGKIHDWPTDFDANLQMIAKISALCNDADVAQAEYKYMAHGIPTEAALKVLVEKMGHPEGYKYDEAPKTPKSPKNDVLRCCQHWKENETRIASLEFDRDRKSMGVIVNSRAGKKSLLVKGAVENVLERSTKIQLLDGSVLPLDQNTRKLIVDALREMSTGALRCLGFAYKEELGELETYDGEDHPAHALLLDPSNYPSIESDLIFVGLAGLRDPPRKEVRQAIEDCRLAGIRVMVFTGDNKNTAEAVCRGIGVFGTHEDISFKSLTGKQFMEVADQKNYLRQCGGLLFSRADPRLKQELVRLLKEDGEVVAVTGDGVNDAPALKLADIGIAMGISGTEVAKESSDMVLSDDNFSTIVSAIGEARSIYNNMQALIRYLISSCIGEVASIFLIAALGVPDVISSDIGEVVSIFLTAALGVPEGLLPVQLLCWVNHETALGFNPPDQDVMKKPPPRRNDSLISAWTLFRSLVIGLYVGVATVGIFIIWYTYGSFMGIDLSRDGHTLVTYSQLTNWGQCSTWTNFTASPFTAGNQLVSFDNSCDYFKGGKVKALTLSLSVLVSIEMFNSLNALSEDGSLLTMPPWVNPWLLLAMSASFGLHFSILYVPFLSHIFGFVPLSLNEWLLIFIVAFPVILIDEVLKFIGRCTSGSQASTRKTAIKPKSE